jgi:hypothetical protein
MIYRAFTDADRQRGHSEHGRGGGHQDRAQADRACLDDGVEGCEAVAAPADLDVFDQQDCVVHHHPDQQHRAEHNWGGKRRLRKPEGPHHPDQ